MKRPTVDSLKEFEERGPLPLTLGFHLGLRRQAVLFVQRSETLLKQLALQAWLACASRPAVAAQACCSTKSACSSGGSSSRGRTMLQQLRWRRAVAMTRCRTSR